MIVSRREIAKEFKDLIKQKDTRTMDQICSSKERGLLPQQVFIQQYTRKYPNWNKLLLYHEIGSGKTCTSILVAEDLIAQDKKIKVILPARLKTNYLDELVTPCAMNRYISKEDALLYNDPKTPVPMKEKIRNKFIKKIEEKYDIMSFDRLKLDIKGKNLDEWIRDFTKNSLIIVDEMHNMVSKLNNDIYEKVVEKNKIDKKDDIEDLNTMVLRLLVHHAHPSCKFLFMTATPVFDNVQQYKNLVAIMAEPKDIPAVMGTFEVSQLTEFLRGKVSYYPGISANAYPEKEYVYHNLEMSETIYNERQKIGKDDKKESFKSQERQTLLFSPRKYDYKKNIKSVLENLDEHSPKMRELLNQISLPGKHVVFTNFVERGINIVTLLLDQLGWANFEDVLKNNSWDKYKNKVYCVWDGESDNKMKQNIKNIMNASDNKFGEKVKVVIGSPSIKEGVSFFQVQHLHILDPIWNYSTKIQIEGRASRYCSHYTIDEVKDNPLLRKVKIHIYKIIAGVPTADMEIYDQIIPQKYEFVKNAENAIKKVAIDYYLFVKLYSEEEAVTYKDDVVEEKYGGKSPIDVEQQLLGQKKQKAGEIKEKEEKEKKPCKPNQVFNPVSKRCVSREGKIGKLILAGEMPPPPKKKGELKPCKEGQVRNPVSKRCVSADGKLGKKVIADMNKNKSPKKSTKKKSKSPKKSTKKKSKSPKKSTKKKSKSPKKSTKKKSKSPKKPQSYKKKSPVKPEQRQIKKLLKKQGITKDISLPYKIIKKLGEGALGNVYLIENEGKKGALKVVKEKIESPNHWGAALMELYTSLYLSGKKYFPKVEKVFYTIDDDGNTPFNIMYEFLEGETLGDFVKTLSTQKEYNILKKKIEDILDYFCKINVVHNDFHLSNIMVIKKGGDYELKVFDFGYTRIEKCNPAVELIKLISIMFMNKVNKELLDTFIELYREKYLGNEKCISGDEKFNIGFKITSPKDVYNEMKNSGLSYKFFNMCYMYYFVGSNVRIPKTYINSGNFWFNIEKNTKYRFFINQVPKDFDFSPYKNYFSKM